MKTFDITQDYNRTEFAEFLYDFLPDDFEGENEEVFYDFANIEEGFRLGTCKSLDLDIFEFRTKSNHDPRVTLTREVVSCMKKFSYAPNALVAFYSEDSHNWRLSLITTDYSVDKNGKTKTEHSNPRRFSFLLGEGCKCHTPEQMLFENGKIRGRTENGKALSAIEDLKSRFDIEVVTKEFYNELFAWYTWACEKATYPVGKGASVKQSSKDNEIALIRLITRLMFVWFIKQKDLVPSWVFDETALKSILTDFDSQSMKKGNYYNAVMQNLFFATLNKAISERKFTDDNKAYLQYGIKTLYRDDCKKSFFKESQKDIIERFKSVPFLNGGLFECLDRLETGEKGENVQTYSDGFSREEKRRAFLPNALFFQEPRHSEGAKATEESHEGIIHILNRYNFTVEENSPSDVQVALDPELLGRVFENLLGTYNPETSETARKDSGSFYTPRPIVNFMVNEAIRNYLKNTVSGISDSDLQKLFDESTALEPVEMTVSTKAAIISALKNIKVLDPACGSGAFPVGVLQQLVMLIKKLDGSYNTNQKVYELKLHLIENCIYGVDIQTIAVQICKLRFFITLICEQEKSDDAGDNYGFNPLPNLETKFVAANSLIGLKSEQSTALDIRNEKLAGLKDELLEIRTNHFRASTAQEKKKYRNDDKAKREEIISFLKKQVVEGNKELVKTLEAENKILEEKIERLPAVMIDSEEEQGLFDAPPKTLFQKDKNEDERKKLQKHLAHNKKIIAHERTSKYSDGDAAKSLEELVSWNPYDQNAVSPFFDANWMFGLSDGFDIVIGNPPYVQLMKDDGRLGKLYDGKGYATYTKMGDVYCLFYEKGYSLLNKTGRLCFITSNKWMRAGYGEKLREFFANSVNPKLLVDFAGVKVFESATVDTNILLLEKGKNEGNTQSCTATALTKDGLANLSDFVRQNSSISNFDSSSSWVILSPIEQSIKAKIEKVGTPLKDWDINIYRGVLTGFNDAFIITGEKRQEILDNCKSEDERKRTDALIRPILRGRDIKRYEYNFADLYLINTHNGIRENGTVKIPRIDIKDYPAVKKHLDEYWDKIATRADKGDTPYNLRNCAYMDELFQPKIIWGEISDKSKFAFDFSGDFMPEATTFYMRGENIEFLLAALNSKLSEWFFSKIGTTTGVGTVRWKKYTIEQLIVIKPSEEILKDYLLVFDKFKNKKMSVTKFEQYNDELIFSLYRLTKAEINYINVYWTKLL